MTHDILNQDSLTMRTLPLENNLRWVGIKLDITELDSAGTETFTATDYIDVVSAGSVLSVENDEYSIVYDHVAGNISVRNKSDGAAVANNTAVGELMLVLWGFDT